MSITLVPFDSPIECMTIDTETTGLDPFDGDEILTLAMVLDIEHRESPSSVHLRVKPQHKTEWPAAERVNHISPDSVVNYKPFKSYLEAVQSLFDRTEKIVGWNVGFDLGFLEHEGIVIPQTAEIVDAMEEFGRVHGPFSESHTRWRLTSAADAMGYCFEGRSARCARRCLGYKAPISTHDCSYRGPEATRHACQAPRCTQT